MPDHRTAHLLLALLLPALAGGCDDGTRGSSGNGEGGTALVAGGALPVSADQATALAGEGTCAGIGMAHAAYAAIVASSGADLCGSWLEGAAVAGQRTVEIVLVDPAAAGALPSAGTYPVLSTPAADAPSATVRVRQLDASCVGQAVSAVAGSVALTASAAERFAGTVIAYLAEGGTLVGAFDASACAAAATADLCAGTVEPVTALCSN